MKSIGFFSQPVSFEHVRSGLNHNRLDFEETSLQLFRNNESLTRRIDDLFSDYGKYHIPQNYYSNDEIDDGVLGRILRNSSSLKSRDETTSNTSSLTKKQLKSNSFNVSKTVNVDVTPENINYMKCRYEEDSEKDIDTNQTYQKSKTNKKNKRHSRNSENIDHVSDQDSNQTNSINEKRSNNGNCSDREVVKVYNNINKHDDSQLQNTFSQLKQEHQEIYRKIDEIDNKFQSFTHSKEENKTPKSNSENDESLKKIEELTSKQKYLQEMVETSTNILKSLTSPQVLPNLPAYNYNPNTQIPTQLPYSTPYNHHTSSQSPYSYNGHMYNGFKTYDHSQGSSPNHGQNAEVDHRSNGAIKPSIHSTKLQNPNVDKFPPYHYNGYIENSESSTYSQHSDNIQLEKKREKRKKQKHIETKHRLSQNPDTIYINQPTQTVEIKEPKYMDSNNIRYQEGTFKSNSIKTETKLLQTDDLQDNVVLQVTQQNYRKPKVSHIGQDSVVEIKENIRSITNRNDSKSIKSDQHTQHKERDEFIQPEQHHMLNSGIQVQFQEPRLNDVEKQKLNMASSVITPPKQYNSSHTDSNGTDIHKVSRRKLPKTTFEDNQTFDHNGSSQIQKNSNLIQSDQNNDHNFEPTSIIKQDIDLINQLMENELKSSINDLYDDNDDNTRSTTTINQTYSNNSFDYKNNQNIKNNQSKIPKFSSSNIRRKSNDKIIVEKEMINKKKKKSIANTSSEFENKDIRGLGVSPELQSSYETLYDPVLTPRVELDEDSIPI